MKRRTALRLGFVLLFVDLSEAPASACEGDDELSGAASSERVQARIGRNHGHHFSITIAEVYAGVEKSYDLTGSSGHRHNVTVTADDFRRIRAGEAVRFATTKEGGHIHRALLQLIPIIEPAESINVCETEIGGRDEHEIVINAADMKAKAQRVYNIQGLAGHNHTVTITPNDFDDLLAGKQVTIPSSVTDGHTHYAYLRYPNNSKNPKKS